MRRSFPRIPVSRLAACLLLSGSAWLAAPLHAQVIPSTLTPAGTYTSASLGLTQGAGGIEFDAAGNTLYIGDPQNGNVIALTVARNANRRITGFGNPTLVVKALGTGTLDGGLAFSKVGTLFLTDYLPGDLEQYSPVTKAHTVTRLKTVGVPGDTGGAEFLPTAGNNEVILVGDYDRGGIYALPLTLQSNLTYAVGQASLWLPTPKGIDSFELVPNGPFGNGGGLLLVNYDDQRIDLVAIDRTTGNPFRDASGAARFVPLITGLREPMDVEFDPVTQDMFVTDYSSGTATLLQFSGEIRGGLDGSYDIFAPGCPQQNGTTPTLDTGLAKMRGGLPITIRLSRAPASQSVSFLLFGLGNSGNLGGFLFPPTTCRAYVNPILTVGFGTDAAGVASLNGIVPTALIGTTLFTQAWALSTGANPLNLTVSDAAVCLVGR